MSGANELGDFRPSSVTENSIRDSQCVGAIVLTEIREYTEAIIETKRHLTLVSDAPDSRSPTTKHMSGIERRSTVR